MVSYADRHKTLFHLLICNKKPRSFLRNRVFCQPVHISLRYSYTGWNLFNCLYIDGVIITICVRNLYEN
jgi:hypothetical protein